MNDEEFGKRLARGFAPEPLTPSQRVAFDEALRARLEKKRRPRILVPALAAAALVALLIYARGFETAPTNGGTQTAAASAEWEYELLYPSELTGDTESDDSELLPDDYLAIASVFLSG
jgi:hypothetical protein